MEPLDRLLEKKRRKIWRVCNKVLLLHPYSRAMLPGTLHFLCLIGVWCNGNTADSGPAFPGSSPGIPTQSIHLSQMDAFFVQLISLPYFFYVTLH